MKSANKWDVIKSLTNLLKTEHIGQKLTQELKLK